jgi:hypothetical protein
MRSNVVHHPELLVDNVREFDKAVKCGAGGVARSREPYALLSAVVPTQLLRASAISRSQNLPFTMASPAVAVSTNTLIEPQKQGRYALQLGHGIKDQSAGSSSFNSVRRR